MPDSEGILSIRERHINFTLLVEFLHLQGCQTKKIVFTELKSQNHIFNEHYLGTTSDYGIHNARRLKPQYTQDIKI